MFNTSKEDCAASGRPASAVNIHTTNDAASQKRQVKVGAQSGEPIDDVSVQAEQLGRSNFVSVESHNSRTTDKHAANAFLGPGGVGILNSEDNYPMFVRPISPTFSVDSTAEHDHTAHNQIQDAVAAPEAARLQEIVNYSTRNDVTEMEYIFEYEELDFRSGYLFGKRLSLWNSERLGKRKRAQSI